eukprot:TRINITY_DN415_c0_g1_i6.p1 TRINITY_DN415_c0_g1~~TRINITY_DN415_c0_g1_i6.p1  ORF type:complete len:2553 (+),score=831.25 TRINITY_DN415_c0_g1_i6:506-8164(+)
MLCIPSFIIVLTCFNRSLRCFDADQNRFEPVPNSASIPKPEATREHVAEMIDTTMVVTELGAVGGAEQTKLFHYVPATNTWTQKQFTPLPYTASCSAVDTGNAKMMYTFGGKTPQGDAKDDMYRYNFDTAIGNSGNSPWTYIDHAITDPWPERRYSCSLEVYNSKPYVFGGFRKDLLKPDAELWSYDFNTASFTLKNISGSWPQARYNHQSTMGGNYMYVFGGRYTNSSGYSVVFDDLWRLNMDTVVWESLTPVTVAKPSARHSFTFVLLGMNFYLHGGVTTNGQDNSELWSYQWTKPGPLIANITASDPDNANVNYDNGDVIDIMWMEPTNTPAAATKGNLDSLFTFSQVLGTDYTGQWTADNMLRITIVNNAGATPPAIGSLRITPKFAGGILNKAGNSQPAITISPALGGNWGIKPGPNITSCLASDPDSSSVFFDNQDRIAITFNMNTNQVPMTTKADIDAQLVFSQPIGLYTGAWQSANLLWITIQDKQSANPIIGQITVSAKSTCTLTDTAGTTSFSAFKNIPITNNWGEKPGPIILRLEGMDIYDLDSKYGKHDIIQVTFDQDTNKPAVATKAQLDAMFNFYTAPGVDYTGSWYSASILRITIVQAGVEPQIGVWHLNVTGDLRDAAYTTFPSRAKSPVLEGNWGTGPTCNFTSCSACLTNSSCGWCESTRTCYPGDTTGPFSLLEVTCPVWSKTKCTDCHERTTCNNCTSNSDCGWCPATRACFHGNNTTPHYQSCSLGWTKNYRTCPGFTFVVYDPATHGNGTTGNPVLMYETGNQVKVGVKLVSPIQPTSDIFVTFASADTSEATVTPNSALHFLASEPLGTLKNMTVFSVDDLMDDGDINYQIVFDPLNATDTNFRGANHSGVYTKTIDNDTGGYNITIIRSLNTTEGSINGTMTVALLTEPVQPWILVPLTCLEPTQLEVYPPTLNFTKTSWMIPQTVNVHPFDDLITDGNINTHIRVGPSTLPSTGNEYGTIQTLVSTAANDNDVPGFLVSGMPIPGPTSEDGLKSTFQVRLASKPIAAVTVPVASSNTLEGVPSITQLVFTPLNWNVNQPVSVTGQDDTPPGADGNITYSINLGPATTTDPAYNGMLQAVPMINYDNDNPGIECLPPSNPTTEEGGTADVKCRLIAAPLAAVSLTFTIDDLTEGRIVGSNQMVFSTSNWATWQTITVQGQDDWVDDNSPYYYLKAVSSSLSLPYHNVLSALVQMVNLDNDTAAIHLSSVNGSLVNLRTSEKGTVIEIMVSLESEPIQTVRMPIINYDNTEIAIDKATIYFNASNWNVPQQVVLNSVPDVENDGDVLVNILFGPCITTDTKYELMTRRIQITNEDLDVSQVNVTWITPQFATPSQPAQFTMVLTSQPTHPVTIQLSTADNTVVTVSPSSVVFTSTNFATPQTVTLTAATSPVFGARRLLAAVGGIKSGAVLIGPIVSQDARYAALATTSVLARRVIPGGDSIIVAAADNDLTAETGTGLPAKVQLVSKPTIDPFVVSVSVDDSTEGSVSPSTLTFTATNWDQLQTITVTGVDDSIVDGTVTYNVVLSPPAGYSPATAYRLPLRNGDFGDTSSVAISNVNPETNENGFIGGFDIQLNSQPQADVTIGIRVSNALEAEILDGHTSVVFTTTNWATKVRVRVKGLADQTNDGDVTYFIVFQPTQSADANYNNLQLSSLTFINRAILIPKFSYLSPEVVELTGGSRVSVTGANFGSGITVRVGTTQLNATQVVRYDSASLSFPAPAQSAVGKYDLTLINTDNGTAVASGALRYAVRCAVSGQYETSSGSCATCPVGGTCPGGNIINANTGYWNNGPESGFVWQCVPSNRCAGNATCGVGYQDQFCGTCQDGYYRTDEYCVKCGHEAWLWLTWIVYVLAWIGMWYFLFSAEDNVQTYIIFALIPLQMLRVIGHSSPSNAPEWLRLFYHCMGIFGLDYDFLRPGCGVDSSLATFSSLYWGNSGVFAINMFILALGYVAKANMSSGQAPLAETHLNRYFRILIIYLTLSYPMWTVRTMQALHCTAPFSYFNNASFLYVEMSVECYSTGHDVAAWAWILMILIVIAFPLFVTIYLIVAYSQNLLMGSSTLANTHARHTFGALYERMMQPAFWFIGLLFLAEFLLSFASVVLIRNPEFRFLLTIAVLSVMILVLAIVQPFELPYLNSLYSTMCSLGFLMAVINFVAHEHFQADIDLVRVLAGFMIMFVLVLTIMFAIMPFIHMKRMEREGVKKPEPVFHPPKQAGQKSPRTPRTLAREKDRAQGTPRSMEEGMALDSARSQRNRLPALNVADRRVNDTNNVSPKSSGRRSVGFNESSQGNRSLVDRMRRAAAKKNGREPTPIQMGSLPPSALRGGPKMSSLTPLQPLSKTRAPLSPQFLKFCRRGDRKTGEPLCTVYDLIQARKIVQGDDQLVGLARKVLALCPQLTSVNPIVYEQLLNESDNGLKRLTLFFNLENAIRKALLDKYDRDFRANGGGDVESPTMARNSVVPPLNLTANMDRGAQRDQEEWEGDDDDGEEWYEEEEEGEWDEDGEEWYGEEGEEGDWDDGYQDGNGYGRQ